MELVAPAGLTVAASALDYDLAAGGHAEFAVTLGADGAAAGTYFLAARIRDERGRILEDVTQVTVGPAPAEDEPFDVTYGPDGLTLPPGGRGDLVLRVHGRARGEIHGEAMLLSPYGTWGTDLHITPWAQGFTVGPGATVELHYTAGAAPTARPGGHWWALVKVACFGRLHYTRAVSLEIST